MTDLLTDLPTRQAWRVADVSDWLDCLSATEKRRAMALAANRMIRCDLSFLAALEAVQSEGLI